MQGWGSEWEKKEKASRGHSVSLSALHLGGQTTMIPNTPSHFIAIPHYRSLDWTGEICLFLTWNNCLFVCFPWRPILGCLWSHWGAEAQHTNTACCDGQRQAGMSRFQCSLCSGPYGPESHTGGNAAFPRKGGGRIVSPLLKTLEKIQMVWVTAGKYSQAFIFHLSLPQPIPKALSAPQLAPDLILTHPSSTVPPCTFELWYGFVPEHLDRRSFPTRKLKSHQADSSNRGFALQSRLEGREERPSWRGGTERLWKGSPVWEWVSE